MRTKEIKTIEIKANEWFDKVNGNSYFSAIVWINDKIRLEIPFTYGYGEHYKDIAYKEIKKQLNCFKKYDDNTPFWKVCQENKIKLIASKKENCKKSELIK